MLTFSIAIDENKGIGFKGKLPWHLKEELQIFKNNTVGKNIVMGQVTYDHLPSKLKDRHTIVVSSDPSYSLSDPDAEVINDLSAFLKEHEKDAEEYIICGGSSIYRQAYSRCQKAYISFVKGKYDVDTWFDAFDIEDWNVVKEEEYADFTYMELERKPTALVTGCTGYIGSHTCVELLNNGYRVIGLDNFSNSKPEVLQKIHEITGKDVKFYEGNMLNRNIMEEIFTENHIDAVIDFAAFKAVGDSVYKPVEYYTNNVSSVLTLLTVMKEHDVKSIVFSSSATVYGDQNPVPLKEDMPIGNTTNPYGTSKVFVEKILQDLYFADNTFNVCVLRYFNPIGAHSSGLIGEEPNGIPANLMPYITKVAVGELECLNIFGDDYDTPDGTCLRDYIHVVDLAKAHVLALDKIMKQDGGYLVYNLGTGHPYSVLDIVNTYSRVNNVEVPYRMAPRRAGDLPMLYADCSKAKEELGWEAELTLEDMCRSSHNFIITLKNK